MEIQSATVKVQQDRIKRLRLIDEIINSELEQRIFLRMDEHQPRYLTIKELFNLGEHMERIQESVREILHVQCH